MVKKAQAAKRIDHFVPNHNPLYNKENIMFKIAKKSLVMVIIATLLLISFGTAASAEEYFEAEDPSGGEMLFDVALVRPVGIIATAVGSVFYVLSLPFSAGGDNVDAAGEKLVKEPARFTFKRPLGEF
jgi:hypothetical protein